MATMRVVQVSRPNGPLEIVERPILREIVRGLRRAMDDRAEAPCREQVGHRRAVADIDAVMGEIAHAVDELLEPPGGVALRPEEVGPHVVVEAVYVMAAPGEIFDRFRADQAARSGDENLHRRPPSRA